MQGINEVRLSGQVSKVYPIKHFDNQKCMLIAEITTTDEVGTFAHRVSFLNADAIAFSKNAQLGAMVNVDAKLTPRLKNKDNPNGEMFFEIRCMRYFFVAESIAQSVNPSTIYPESLEDKPKPETILQKMFKSFKPQNQIPKQENIKQENKPVIYERPKKVTYCANVNSYKA